MKKNDDYKNPFSVAARTIAVIAVLAVINIFVVTFVKDTQVVSWTILIFAFIKTALIVRLSFDLLRNIIGKSHLLSQILFMFGIYIGLIIVSFAIDFASLQFFDSGNFKSEIYESNTAIEAVFEHLYFSVITFFGVGYGDIVPASMPSRTLAILEVVLRFFVLGFGIANINQTRVGEK